MPTHPSVSFEARVMRFMAETGASRLEAESFIGHEIECEAAAMGALREKSRIPRAALERFRHAMQKQVIDPMKGRAVRRHKIDAATRVRIVKDNPP